jgi:hypothetical protein
MSMASSVGSMSPSHHRRFVLGSSPRATAWICPTAPLPRGIFAGGGAEVPLDDGVDPMACCPSVRSQEDPVARC